MDIRAELLGIQELAHGYNGTCALTTSGGVKCWGINSRGEVGDGTTYSRTLPVDVIGLGSGVSAIARGGNLNGDHTCVVTTSGGVKCWGRNANGELGDGTTTYRTAPVDVPTLTSGVSAVGAGSDHTCALADTGLFCWGSNSYGQFGNGTTVASTVPVLIPGIVPGEIQSMSLHYLCTCILTTDGGVKCWGYNGGGLGDGTTTNRSSPVSVVGLSSGVTQMFKGYLHGCVIMSGGGVKCWGYNNHGQVGDGTKTNRLTPVDIVQLSGGVTSLALGIYNSCAITSTGGVKCWGSNEYLTVGDQTSTDRTLPQDVAGLSSGVQKVYAGNYHTCALMAAGAVRCWGDGGPGRFGDGTSNYKAEPTNVLGLTTGVHSISVGYLHRCASTDAGIAKCWGSNGWGQVGAGGTTPLEYMIPMDVTVLASGIQTIAAEGQHTCVLTTSGGVQCWGWNDSSQRGDGSLTSGVNAISLGYNHSCALTSEGGVKCWGKGGRLGNGLETNSAAPVDVVGLTAGVQMVEAGQYHSCALTTTGALKCWGDNDNGQLGDGTKTNSSLAVDIIGLTAGVQTVSAGGWHTCAVVVSGEVKCWGLNDDGQLGDGTLVGTTEPVTVVGITGGVAKLTAGKRYTCALTTAGGIKCWGRNASGQLGNRDKINQLTPVDVSNGGSGFQELASGDGMSCGITVSGAMKCWGLVPGDGDYGTIRTAMWGMNARGIFSASGIPVEGVTLTARSGGYPFFDQVVSSDGSGNYSISLVDGNSYTMTPSHVGYTFSPPSITVSMTSDIEQDFVAVPNSFSLGGVITENSSPLQGVAVDGGALGTQNTDVNGYYSFSTVNYGTNYVVTPTLVGYSFSPTSATGQLVGNTTHNFVATYLTDGTTTVTTVPSTASSTTTVEITTTEATTTVPYYTTTSAMQETTTVPVNTTIGIETTTVPVQQTTTTVLGDGGDIDSDGDGVTDSEEIATGTNPKDPGSHERRLPTVFCSDWNGYLAGDSGRGMYNIMEHNNLTAKKLRLKTELRSIRGHLKSTSRLLLRGYQQFDLLVHDMAGREVNSYGQVCTSYQGAPEGSVDGRMVHYKIGSDDDEIEFAIAVPFEAPARGKGHLLHNSFQVSLDPEDVANLVANWVQITNVSKKRLNGTLYFHALDGKEMGRAPVNLRDGARYDYGAHLWGGNAGLARFVPSKNDVDYRMGSVRYVYDNSTGKESFASAVYVGSASGSGETLISPVAGDGLDVNVELSNTHGNTVSASIKLYDQSGKKDLYRKTHSLKAYSSLHINLGQYLNGSEGLIEVKGSQAGSIIASVMHYLRTPQGGIRSIYSLPLREPVGKTMRASYNTYLSQGCKLYLGNRGSTKEVVTVSVKQNSAASAIKDYRLQVPAHGVVVDDLCAKLPKDVYGMASVTSTSRGKVYGSLVRKGADSRYMIGVQTR